MKVLLDIPNEHIDNAMPQLLAECESEERVSLMNKLCDEAKTSDEPVEIDLSCLGEEYVLAAKPIYDVVAMSTIAFRFYKEICQKDDCPFLQEHYKKYPRKPRKNEPTLF